MIRRCSIKNLEPGMTTGRPVFSGTGATLIPTGTELNEGHIKNVLARGLSEVWIVDKRMEGVEIEEALSDATKIKVLQTIRSVFQEARQSSGLSSINIPEMVIIDIGREIVDELLRDKNKLVSLFETTTPDTMLPIHTVNATLLSVLTGFELGFNDHQLLDLAVGALLFDIGMAMVEDSSDSPGELTAEELVSVRKHTEEGFKLLQRYPMINSAARAIALQHHERYDGSGYPKGLKGDQIHIYARIVAIADSYDALTAPRPHRKRYLPHEAYEFVITSGGFDFDHRVVKAFANCVAPYPVGTMVELSNGMKGVVCSVKKGQTSRPQVRALYNPDGSEVEGVVDFDLAQNPSVMISGLVEE